MRGTFKVRADKFNTMVAKGTHAGVVGKLTMKIQLSNNTVRTSGMMSCCACMTVIHGKLSKQLLHEVKVVFVSYLTVTSAT